MLSPSARKNRKIVLLVATILLGGTSIGFAQGGGAAGGGGTAGGGAGGGPGGAGGGTAVPSGPPPTPSASPSVTNPSSPNTVPQQSSTPLKPSTPNPTPSTSSTTSSGEVAAPANEEAARTTARSERRSAANGRPVHHHRGRLAGPAPGSHYYCGSSPCFRIYPSAIYGYAAPAHGVVAAALWWPGYYDYAPGQWGRGRPRYGGQWRSAGYHGD